MRYLNLDKALLFPKNQVICLKNLKLWRAPTTVEFNIFLLKFCTRFLLNNVYKNLLGIFFVLFKSWVIKKKWEKLVFCEYEETRSFLIDFFATLCIFPVQPSTETLPFLHVLFCFVKVLFYLSSFFYRMKNHCNVWISKTITILSLLLWSILYKVKVLNKLT